MKIAAFLGAKDEVELVGLSIKNLREIGVDHIIAGDSRSKDGTAEILKALARGPGFDFLDYDDMNPDPDHETRVTAGIIAQAENAGADWLLFGDADEFALPMTGQLRDVAGLDDVDALEIDRFNVPLLETGPAIGLPVTDAARGDVLLYAPDEARPATQARVRRDADAPWVAAIPAPKLMMRLNRGFVPKEGHHGVTAPSGPEPRVLVPADLIIAHVPFTTEARFARKMANVQAIWEKTGHHWGPHSAWHWRRWLDNIAERGGVAGEIARNMVSAQELAELRRLGLVKTAYDLLNRG